MQKNEFLTFLKDDDVGKEIFEIIRRGGRPTGVAYTQSPEWYAAKAEFLVYLQDSDICKEMFEILKRGIKANKESESPVPSPSPPAKSITKDNTYSNLMAQREQVRHKITHKKNSDSAQNPVEDKKAGVPAAERKNFLSAKLKFLKDQVQIIESNDGVEDVIGDDKFYIVVEKDCPICGKKTRVIQSKTRLVVDKQDIDFCTHYKNYNPYLNSIWACEKCGYVADEVRFQERIPDRIRKLIKAFLSKNDLKTPFAEIRDKDEALTLYEIAIYLNRMFEHSKGRQGLLYQKMAWICRLENDTEKEKEYLLNCAELLEQSVLNERYPIGKVTDDTATYIIGVNYYMLNQFDKATKFLGNIITASNIRTSSPKLYEKARDIWQDIRQARKQ